MKWSPGEQQFFNVMDAHPRAVYIATLYLNGQVERMAVFSNQMATHNWVTSFPETSYDCSIVVPFVIDEPEFGNAILN